MVIFTVYRDIFLLSEIFRGYGINSAADFAGKHVEKPPGGKSKFADDLEAARSLMWIREMEYSESHRDTLSGIKEVVDNGASRRAACWRALNNIRGIVAATGYGPGTPEHPANIEKFFQVMATLYAEWKDAYLTANEPGARYRSYADMLSLELGRYCSYCESPLISLDVEHKLPKSESYGLILDYRNLLPACRACNSKKNTWPSMWTYPDVRVDATIFSRIIDEHNNFARGEENRWLRFCNFTSLLFDNQDALNNVLNEIKKSMASQEDGSTILHQHISKEETLQKIANMRDNISNFFNEEATLNFMRDHEAYGFFPDSEVFDERHIGTIFTYALRKVSIENGVKTISDETFDINYTDIFNGTISLTDPDIPGCVAIKSSEGHEKAHIITCFVKINFGDQPGTADAATPQRAQERLFELIDRLDLNGERAKADEYDGRVIARTGTWVVAVRSAALLCSLYATAAPDQFSSAITLICGNVARSMGFYTVWLHVFRKAAAIVPEHRRADFTQAVFSALFAAFPGTRPPPELVADALT
jgi:hypothetical protein